MRVRPIFAALLLAASAGSAAERVAQNAGPVARLWSMQPVLVGKALDALPPRVPGRRNVYAVAAAAGGRQQLFAREAKLALDVAAARFAGDYRGGVLLSNGTGDLAVRPLAVPATMAAAFSGLGRRLDPAQDMVFLYLASHGSPDATLETDLANFDRFVPISARSTAAALKRSGIRRRIIIVSACFAGSWAPALAGPDTILIAAARRDRTSFGCDDTRRLTYFGEAMLAGPLARGASLHEAFDAARAKVAQQEAAEKLEPSQPQAYIGRNMRDVWDERSPASSAASVTISPEAR